MADFAKIRMLDPVEVPDSEPGTADVATTGCYQDLKMTDFIKDSAEPF